MPRTNKGAVSLKMMLALAGGAVVVGGGAYVAYSQLSKQSPTPSAQNAPQTAAEPTAPPPGTPPASEPSAQPTEQKAELTFMEKLQAEGKPYTCDFDFSKAQLPKVDASAEAQKAESDFYASMGAKNVKPILTDPKLMEQLHAQLQGMAQKTVVKLSVKGPMIRTDASFFGITLKTMFDTSAGLAYFGVTGAPPGSFPAGCDYFSFNVDQMAALAA